MVCVRREGDRGGGGFGDAVGGESEEGEVDDLLEGVDAFFVISEDRE